MGPSAVRRATADDAAEVAALVDAAYGHYVERIGTRPGPMRDDYAAAIRDRQVLVVPGDAGADDGAGRDGLAGVLVLDVTGDGFLLENVAVHPAYQGRGLGRVLLDRAEAEARAAGFDAIYLYTHELMTENQAIYAVRGYVEYDRRTEFGLTRVFMRKRLPPGPA
jgi:GNAT superfamily N-acetyltransferase